MRSTCVRSGIWHRLIATVLGIGHLVGGEALGIGYGFGYMVPGLGKGTEFAEPSHMAPGNWCAMLFIWHKAGLFFLELWSLTSTAKQFDIL